MNDDNNLTPEELEKLQREEAQQKTGPNLYDRISGVKSDVDTAKQIKNIVEGTKLKNITGAGTNLGTSATGAAATGTAASGATATGAAATGTAATGTAATGTAATGAAASGAAATGAAASGAAATGAAATGAAATGAAATGAAATPVGWIVLIVIAVILIILFLVLFFNLMYYNVIEPISSKYSVSEDDIVNKYDVNFVIILKLVGFVMLQTLMSTN